MKVQGRKYRYNKRKHAFIYVDNGNMRAIIKVLTDINDDYGTGWKELGRHNNLKIVAVEFHLSKETIELFHWFAHKYL